MSEKWKCGDCGGTRIQRVCWVDPNTEKVGEDFGDHNEHHFGKTWCNDCEEHTRLVLDGAPDHDNAAATAATTRTTA